jgi:hypothetical protein
MSDKVEVVQSSGLGLTSILTIIFVIAKLAGVVKWSWWLVFSPVIMSFVLFMAILFVLLGVAGIAVYFGSK